MMSQDNFVTLLNFFKVLGNETRLRLLGLLANQERSVGELATLLGLREPTISHHLHMMREFGLVDVQAAGNMRIYRLNTRFLETMSADLLSQEKLADMAQDVVGNEAADSRWESKVLHSSLSGERIVAIPAQYKKQFVLAKWLVQKFEMDRRYTEQEVNEIIKRHHEDFAWFRRSFVDHGLMQREKGVYWRLPTAVTDPLE